MWMLEKSAVGATQQAEAGGTELKLAICSALMCLFLRDTAAPDVQVHLYSSES